MSKSFLRVMQNKDVVSAVIFGILGISFVVNSLSLSFGSPDDMGPAFFPRVVGIGLVALAAMIGLKGVANSLSDDQEGLRISLRPILYVLVAIVLFIVTLRSLGLIVASLLLVTVTGTASRDRRWTEVAVMAVVLSILTGFLFVYGLGLQAPLLPWR